MTLSTIDYIMIPVLLVAGALIIGKKMGGKTDPAPEEPSPADLIKRIETLEAEVAALKKGESQ